MKRKPDTHSSDVEVFTVELTRVDVKKLDSWIASRKEAHLSRSQAIRKILALGLIHGREVEYLRRHVAQADKDIREQFDRVFNMIDRVRDEVPAKPIAPKRVN